MLEDDYFLGTKLYHKKFVELCKPIVDYLSINSILYANVDAEGRAILLYYLKDWGERVIEKKHYKVEPLLVQSNNIHNGFSFDSANESQEFKDTLLYDGGVNFNWWHSFVYVEKNLDNKGYFGIGFATHKDNHMMTNRVINETRIIKKAIKKLNQHLQPITQALEDKRVDLPQLKGDAYYTQTGSVFHKAQDNQQTISLLGDLGISEQGITKPLSPQEIGCLRSYLLNPNVKSVARELDLAVSTVSGYLENIKNKLACFNKEDLLRKAAILESLGHI